jgi:hypothetical protein
VERRSLHSMVFGLCLMALLVASGVQAASLVAAGFPEAEALVAPTIRFDPSSSTVSTGATLGVNIVVDNAADLGGFEFTMTFDPAVVTAVTVTLGSFLGSTGRSVGAVTPIIDNTTGTVKYAAFSWGVGLGPDETGTLAVVTLQAVAAGSTSLNFSQAQLTDTQWDPMTVVTPTMTSGTVTVSTETTSILGDVNGDELVDSTDALIILSADVGVNTSQFCPMNCGDVNADGYIDSTDALIVLSYDVGMTVPFPIGQPGCPSSVTQPPGCTP